MYQRTRQIFEQKLGADHPDTAMVLNNLANLYRDQGNITEAGSGSMEDDIASENTTSSEGSDGGHPPQVSHYPEAEPSYTRRIFAQTLAALPRHRNGTAQSGQSP